MNRLTLELTLFSTDVGGRRSPVVCGYRPQFSIDDPKNSTSFFLERIENQEAIEPGDSAVVEGRLLHPEFFKGLLTAGAKFELREGATIVGSGTVLSVTGADDGA